MYLLSRANEQEHHILSEIAFESKGYWSYPQSYLDLWAPELLVSQEMIARFISYKISVKEDIVAFWCREPVEELSDGRLFVRPNHIGQGCGRMLWEAVMKDAKDLHDLKKMTWEVDPHSLGFYLKMGAKLVGKVPSQFIPGMLLPIVEVRL